MAKMQVKSIALRYIHFEENIDFENEEEQAAFPFEIGGGHSFDEETMTLVVDLGVRTSKDITKEEEERVPFFFDIMYQGVFEFSPDAEMEMVEYFAEVNCLAIIFPYIREALGDAVRRANFPPFVLPSVNFQRRAEDKKSIPEVTKESKSSTKKKQPSKKKTSQKKSTATKSSKK